MKVLLLYPPEQSWPGTMFKPNGSLALPMIAGALRQNNIEVAIFDSSVGNEKDNLQDILTKPTKLESGLLRTGVSPERILEEVKDYDIIGITSIFSHQESMVLWTVSLIKKEYPDKTIICGGVNARNRVKKFLDEGVDIIVTGEGEKPIVKLVKKLGEGKDDFETIPALAFKRGDEIIYSRGIPEVTMNLDELPFPAYDLLPNKRYWKIARPSGGQFEEKIVKYACVVTSLGCPFACKYCHIGGEVKGSVSGEMGRFRIKSDERVIEELTLLKNMGVEYVFIEDDTLFGYKNRALRLIKKIKSLNLKILDVNGFNVVHFFKDGDVDFEMINVLKESGFRDICLAFESANQRILKKYASNKWDTTNPNVMKLIRECKKQGLNVEGNFMIGFPDETREEIETTIRFAKECVKNGLSTAGFYLVMPLPGSPLFSYAIENNHLPENYDPDTMHWQKTTMINTLVPNEELKKIRDRAWEEVNRSDFVEYKKKMVVGSTAPTSDE
ncbi:MAG: radical SAM protein [Nanoarchaeota archaeon]